MKNGFNGTGAKRTVPKAGGTLLNFLYKTAEGKIWNFTLKKNISWDGKVSNDI